MSDPHVPTSPLAAGPHELSLARALARSLERKAWMGVRALRWSASEPALGSASEPALGSASEPALGSASEPAGAREDRPRADPDAVPFADAGAPAGAGSAAPAPPTAAVARGAATLAELRACVAACTACGLAATRTQTVFCDGPERAKVMFVGEAPGADEDAQGVPFVGRAGALLTDIVTKGMGLSRSQVHIANVLKCRPPGNRDPEPEEKALCTPFLDRQIELVDPEILITLGLHASRHVLGRVDSMGRLRGRVHRVRGRRVVATYHPAFLLRSPHMKRACWEDIQLAMAELGLPLPPTRRSPPSADA